MNYEIFLTTHYVTVTRAVTGRGEYSYEITASELDIDQILSTFRFTNWSLEALAKWDKFLD